MFFTLRILNVLKTMDWRVRESHGHLLHLTFYTQPSPIIQPARWWSKALTHTYVAVISELSRDDEASIQYLTWKDRSVCCSLGRGKQLGQAASEPNRSFGGQWTLWISDSEWRPSQELTGWDVIVLECLSMHLDISKLNCSVFCVNFWF